MNQGQLFFITSQLNGRVLDVQEGSTENGANIIVYKKKSQDNLNQLWCNENGYIINAKSAKVLDIRGGQLDPDSEIIQYSQKKTADAANQKWVLDEQDYVFCKDRPDLVLDIRGGQDQDGVPVILYNRREGQAAYNQLWTFEPVN